MASTYVPGVCNIGREEIKLRKFVGWLGIACTLILWGYFISAKVEPLWRLSLFFPAMMGAIGIIQAQMGFCAKYGMGGVFSFGPEVGKTDTVEQAEYRKQDRKKALLIVGLSVMIAGLVAAAGFLIPV